MPIQIESKRKSPKTLEQRYPNAYILDVTSRGPQPWVKFSPFYPHGNIPVPLSPGYVAASVEGIWQGLKVFATADIDLSSFTNTTMNGLKRTVRTNGPVRGHRAGVQSTALLSYRDARQQIYLPAYYWVLEHCLQAEIEQLRQLSQAHTVILLDYETNTNIDDLSKPLSHAALVVQYVTGHTPNDIHGDKGNSARAVETILREAREQIQFGSGITHDDFWRDVEAESQATES